MHRVSACRVRLTVAFFTCFDFGSANDLSVRLRPRPRVRSGSVQSGRHHSPQRPKPWRGEAWHGEGRGGEERRVPAAEPLPARLAVWLRWISVKVIAASRCGALPPRRLATIVQKKSYLLFAVLRFVSFILLNLFTFVSFFVFSVFVFFSFRFSVFVGGVWTL